LDAVLGVFGCDRAFLIHPCDPSAPSFRATMERTRPEHPGLLALGVEVPQDAETARNFRALLDAGRPVRFGPTEALPLPAVAEAHGVRSAICIAVRPKVDRPYCFGLHQCSATRLWTADEERLLGEVGR